MIKDLSMIREELIGFAEVEMPYDFPENCHIKYVTFKDDEESFYVGGKFCKKVNDVIILKNNGPTWNVPICYRDKGGNIIYQSRFFISEDIDDSSDEPIESKSTLVKQLTDKIEYQQNIIEKLIERVKEVEVQKHESNETISTYEELLQEGRFKLKELSIDLREKTDKLNHYEELIPKLYNSR
jgi:hypothetical protein